MNVEVKHAGPITFAAAAAAAAMSASGPALAADFPVKAREPGYGPVPTWQGFYIGGSVGASWLNSSQDDSAAAPLGYYGGTGSASKASGLGWLGGLQVGYNWQDRNFVIGAEADFSWIGDGQATSQSSGLVGYGYNASKSSRVDALSTFRARFGYDINGTMPYLTVGVAFGEVKNSYTISGGYYAPAGFSASTSKTSWEPGVVVGAGIEHQFGTHWSARAEVLWVGFKDTQLAAPFFAPGAGSPGTVTFSNDMVIGKLGLNYRF